MDQSITSLGDNEVELETGYSHILWSSRTPGIRRHSHSGDASNGQGDGISRDVTDRMDSLKQNVQLGPKVGQLPPSKDMK